MNKENMGETCPQGTPMPQHACPRIVIAGTASGVGKTSITLGLARALARSGLKVQTFKVGPDFLDPTYLAAASGRTCYNLDSWMMGPQYVQDLFARAAADADIAVVEGVMGMFDGASPSTLEGSTAEIAILLSAPVLLVVNSHGAARSMAATVKGFAELEPQVKLAGVVANNSGSPRHAAWLGESLAAAKLPPLAGAVPRGALPALQSRHLGLVTADSSSLPTDTIEQLADAVARHLDIEKIVRSAKAAACGKGDRHAGKMGTGSPGCLGVPVPFFPEGGTNKPRIGVAKDQAFHFYYADNLEALESSGLEVVSFSPMSDSALPDGLAAIYLGGGYPEVYAQALSANKSMLESIRRFAAAGRCIYAECGGLMYLGRGVRTQDGAAVPLAGVLPIDTEMLPKLQSLGYAEVMATPGGLWGEGAVRGHEFHYSRIVADDSAAAGWRAAYTVRRRRDGADAPAGFAKGNILASYIHLHFASRPEALAGLVRRCEEVQ